MAKIISKYRTAVITLIFLVIVIIEFRSLVFNLNKAFIDWGDTPFIAWQITTTRDKLLDLDFRNIATTNSHYPFKNSLFFTDTFLGQSVMALPLFFIKNPVTVYNLIFLTTVFLNYLAVFWLFRKIFNSATAGILAAVFLNNSVYFFDQIIHLQTITYWPIIIADYYLFDLKSDAPGLKIKSSILAAVFLSIQFYMAVYLGIFSVFFAAVIFALLSVTGFLRKKNKFGFIRRLAIEAFVIGSVFIGLTYPFLIKGYLDFQKTYHQVRDMNEIIANSGNITDYLLFLPGTVFSSLKPVADYNSHARFTTERVSFPGFILVIGALIGFATVKLKKDPFFPLLFLSMIGTGFVFSLGPRLMANGKYMVTPLPYLVLLKQFDFLFSIRLTHRWAFFLILGLIYFAVKLYSKLPKRLIIIVLILFFLESTPKITAQPRNYIDNSYRFLKNSGLRNKVLLEYPLLNFDKGVGVDTETTRLLASVYHRMRLFNGYTGLFVHDYGTTRIFLEKFFPDGQTDGLLKSLAINYLKIDKRFVSVSELEKIRLFYGQPVYEDGLSVIYKIEANRDLAETPQILSGFSGDHAYGKDRKLYVNLFYKNTAKKYFANINQDKQTLKMNFYKSGRLVRTKEIFNLYPLVLFPGETRPLTFDLYEKPGFDKVRIDLFDSDGKRTDSRTSNVSK